MESRVADWQDAKWIFDFDGSWRDIYVLDTTIEDWQRFLDMVRQGPWRFEWTVDGVPAPLPESAARCFEVREHARRHSYRSKSV